jgi:hypothetical protein
MFENLGVFSVFPVYEEKAPGYRCGDKIKKYIFKDL